MSQILKLKKSGSPTETITFTNEKLKESLDFDIEEFSSTMDEKGLQYLKKEKNFSSENLNIFADILYELAEQCFEDPETHTQGLKYYAHSLHIYEFIEDEEKIYSIDRNVRIAKIRDLIK